MFGRHARRRGRGDDHILRGVQLSPDGALALELARRRTGEQDRDVLVDSAIQVYAFLVQHPTPVTVTWPGSHIHCYLELP